MNTRANTLLLVWLSVAVMPLAWGQNTTVAKVKTGAQISEIVMNHKGQDTQKDTDGDGLPDALELQIGTDPTKKDTDGDGTPDGVEAAYGSNPLTAGNPPEILYLAKTLPMPAGYSSGEIMDIGNGDYAAGNVYSTSGDISAVRWRLSTGAVEAAGAPDSYAEAVNDAGVVVGQNASLGGFRWLPGQPLQTIGSNQTFYAWDVSAAGDVVGEAYRVTTGDTGAFHLKAGASTITHLPLIPGYNNARAMGLNTKGEVGGMFYNSGTNSVTSAIWSSAGAPTLLEVLGPNNRGSNFVYGIGEDGTVIGIKGRKARVWPKSGPAQFLPTEPETANSYAWKINRAGEIVGEMNATPVVWRPDGQGGWTRVGISALIMDSNAEIADSFLANSINDRGEIAGSYYKPSTNQDVPVILTPILKPSLAVDANRDGAVKLPNEDASDVTTPATPYRFWVNDDIDRLHNVDESDIEQDDIGMDEVARWNAAHPQDQWKPDWEDGKIINERDLEDFSRLHLGVGNLVEKLSAGEYFLGLKFKDVTSGDPRIRIYPAADDAGGLTHFTQSGVAALQIYDPNYKYGQAVIDRTGVNILSKDRTFVFSLAQWQASHKSYFFLFEAAMAGAGRLALVVLAADAQTEVCEAGSVYLDLRDIKEMHEHWTVGNDEAVAPLSSAQLIHAGAFQYGPQSPEELKYILFVHGWNMERWEKERFAETAFKRLYWHGYKGRFGLFSWPTADKFEGTFWKATTDPTNYDRSEYNAWASAAALREKLIELNSRYAGELYVMAHSMGNVVVGEALRLESDGNGGQIAKVYVASQAALPAHLYDGTIAQGQPFGSELQFKQYNHESIPTGPRDYGPHTPNIYKNWLAFLLNGSVAGSAKSVGKLARFYNQNDWALASPRWEFNQITKPDYPDYPKSPWEYYYLGETEAAPVFNGFRKFGIPSGEVILSLGGRENPQSRYEIMAFAAEARSRAFGATDSVNGLGVSSSVNLRDGNVWGPDPDGNDHRAHKWHSAQFRSTLRKQINYWRTLLGAPGFEIPVSALP